MFQLMVFVFRAAVARRRRPVRRSPGPGRKPDCREAEEAMPEQEREHASVLAGVQAIQGAHQAAVHSEELGTTFSGVKNEIGTFVGTFTLARTLCMATDCK